MLPALIFHYISQPNYLKVDFHARPHDIRRSGNPFAGVHKYLHVRLQYYRRRQSALVCNFKGSLVMRIRFARPAFIFYYGKRRREYIPFPSGNRPKPVNSEIRIKVLAGSVCLRDNSKSREYPEEPVPVGIKNQVLLYAEVKRI